VSGNRPESRGAFPREADLCLGRAKLVHAARLEEEEPDVDVYQAKKRVCWVCKSPDLLLSFVTPKGRLNGPRDEAGVDFRLMALVQRGLSFTRTGGVMAWRDKAADNKRAGEGTESLPMGPHCRPGASSGPADKPLLVKRKEPDGEPAGTASKNRKNADRVNDQNIDTATSSVREGDVLGGGISCVQAISAAVSAEMALDDAGVTEDVDGSRKVRFIHVWPSAGPVSLH